MREAELLILRQIHEQLQSTNNKVDKLTETVQDLREDMARMEGTETAVSDLKAENKLLWEKITVLEADRNARAGAAKFVDYIYRFGPWLLAGAAYLLFGRK